MVGSHIEHALSYNKAGKWKGICKLKCKLWKNVIVDIMIFFYYFDNHSEWVVPLKMKQAFALYLLKGTKSTIA